MAINQTVTLNGRKWTDASLHIYLNRDKTNTKKHIGDDADDYKTVYVFDEFAYIKLKNKQVIVSEMFKYDAPCGFGVIYTDSSMTVRDRMGNFDDAFTPTNNITIYRNKPNIPRSKIERIDQRRYTIVGKFEIYNKNGKVCHSGENSNIHQQNTGSRLIQTRKGIITTHNKKLVYHDIETMDNTLIVDRLDFIEEFVMYHPDTDKPMLVYKKDNDCTSYIMQIVDLDGKITDRCMTRVSLDEFGLDASNFYDMSKKY
jgi:hypothetical protein